MEKNTKKYLKDLIDWLEIETNTIQEMAKDICKTRKKLQKFYDKVIKNY